MDPHALVQTAGMSGLPAPHWFVQFFKVLGLTLHLVPMNLWFAGALLSMLLYWFGGEHARRWSARMMGQMPVLIAFGVNLGIVPLLFIQLAYSRVFYPATILMAWFWFAVILLLLPAYYGVYYYAFAVKGGVVTARHRAAGWLAAVAMLLIGFFFANAMSLMTRVGAWPTLWMSHQQSGAALGTALNVTDPTMHPRWFLMFGLALGTTAVWSLVDGAWFAWRESPEYRDWVRRFALRLYAIGFVWTAAVGSWYVFRTWDPAVRREMFAGMLLPLTLLTGAAPGLPLAWLLLRSRQAMGKLEVTLLGLAQFGVLGINATSRQVVQNLELRPFLDVLAQPTNVQWSPLLAFLICFVLGLAVVVWIVAQLVRVEKSTTYPGSR